MSQDKDSVEIKILSTEDTSTVSPDDIRILNETSSEEIVVTYEEVMPPIHEDISQQIVWIEDEREDVEDLFNRIVILPDKTWRDLTDNELGDIEVKLIEEAKESVDDRVVIIDKESDSSQPSKSSAQQIQDYWDKYTLEQRQLFGTQEKAINTLYANRNFNTPILVSKHHKQEHVGQDGIWSCAVASSLNALHALKLSTPSDTENTIINAVGGRSAFAPDGYLYMSKVCDFLRSRNLLVRDSGNMLELIQTLENGGVALIAYGGHARLISGAETRNSQVFIRMNDPLFSEVSYVPVQELMKNINQTRSFYNMFLLERPLDIDIL